MLYEILSIILVIYAVMSPIWVIKAVKFGISVGKDPKEAAEEPVFHTPEKEEKKRPAVLTPEEQKYIDILENVDIFDGTSHGQKEIEV